MNIYLAGAVHRKLEMRVRAITLEGSQYGHNVVSRWHSEDDTEGGPMWTRERRAQKARNDIEDMMKADCFIVFTEPYGTEYTERTGHHVEFGFMLGINVVRTTWSLHEGNPVNPGPPRLVVVGPERHVFHALADERYADSNEFFLAWSEAARAAK